VSEKPTIQSSEFRAFVGECIGDFSPIGTRTSRRVVAVPSRLVIRAYETCSEGELLPDPLISVPVRGRKYRPYPRLESTSACLSDQDPSKV
jgi:hypothetical protein